MRTQAGSHFGIRCYTSDVPTTRHRHMITETDEISAAMEAAARRWPADRRRPARLLRHLIEAGAAAIAEDADRGLADRRAAIEAARGSLSGVYEHGYLDDLRDEWPA